MSYIDQIKEKARADKKTIVLPETNDKRTLIAASHILEEGIADIIMIGDEEKIRDGAGWLEVELDGVTVINPQTIDKMDKYVELLYETRKAKGMTLEKAEEIIDRLNKEYVHDSDVILAISGSAGMGLADKCHIPFDFLLPFQAVPHKASMHFLHQHNL